VRKVGPFLLGEIALDFEWSAVQASDWPATYFLGHRGLDLRNYAPALLWPGVNDDPGAALPVSVARRRFPIELLAFLPFSPAPRASLPPVGAVSRHPSLATVVAHIRARPHSPPRRLIPTSKNRS